MPNMLHTFKSPPIYESSLDRNVDDDKDLCESPVASDGFVFAEKNFP